jgi:ABC-type transporter Mla maintaining outer membrane lipid asymmetry permease subunit MlaE
MLTVFTTKVKTKIEHLGDAGLNIVESSGRLGVFLFNILSRLWMYRFPLEETIKQLLFIGARTVPLILI